MIIEQHIINMTDSIASIDPIVISTALRDAKIHVINDGVVETHSMFDMLHKYYAMHLLQLWGHVEDIYSEEVGDVKSTFRKTDYAEGETKWYATYKRELDKILGP